MYNFGTLSVQGVPETPSRDGKWPVCSFVERTRISAPIYYLTRYEGISFRIDAIPGAAPPLGKDASGAAGGKIVGKMTSLKNRAHWTESNPVRSFDSMRKPLSTRVINSAATKQVAIPKEAKPKFAPHY